MHTEEEREEQRVEVQMGYKCIRNTPYSCAMMHTVLTTIQCGFVDRRVCTEEEATEEMKADTEVREEREGRKAGREEEEAQMV